jgi:hypothetical protein
MGNILKSPAALDPLGLFEGYKNPTDEELESKFEKYRRDNPYMPATDDQKAMAAKRKSRRQQAGRRGRSSTINTAMGSLG